MKVHVDQEKCQGHNRCFAIAPELFDVDDFGQSHELNDGVVAPGLEEKARLAAANCPEFAIVIEDGDRSATEGVTA
jgi:ferredoxin